MSQKNSVNWKPFYPDSYPLLTSTSLTDLNISQQEISLKITKCTTGNIRETDEKLQPTYIDT